MIEKRFETTKRPIRIERFLNLTKDLAMFSVMGD
jgi:hypothetical protein